MRAETGERQVRSPEEIADSRSAVKSIIAETKCRECGELGVDFYRPVKGTVYPLSIKGEGWPKQFIQYMARKLVPLCAACGESFRGEPKLYGEWSKLPAKARADRYKWLALTADSEEKRALFWVRYNDELTLPAKETKGRKQNG